MVYDFCWGQRARLVFTLVLRSRLENRGPNPHGESFLDHALAPNQQSERGNLRSLHISLAQSWDNMFLSSGEASHFQRGADQSNSAAP